MFKHFKKTKPILILLIFFLIIPGSFALENHTNLDSDASKNLISEDNPQYNDINPNKRSELNEGIIEEITTKNDDFKESVNTHENDSYIEENTSPQIKNESKYDNLESTETINTKNPNYEFNLNNTIIYSNQIDNEINDYFSEALPLRYDLRDYGYVTPVKDQGERGACWAFTALSVLESCILKSTGINYDFSENNLINMIKGHSNYGLKNNDDGGTILNALAYLLSWLGPINEIDDPYTTGTRTAPLLNSLFHVQNVLFLNLKNSMDLNPIKDAIMKYGAVGSSIHWDDSYEYTKGPSYYYYSNEIHNHAITIVGWDDTYSRYNFNKVPNGDGAWIVKNSWGTNIGDQGYFYVSYYDTSINSGTNYIYTFILNDTTPYEKNYQYDYAGITEQYSYYSNQLWVKNVFTSTNYEYLISVSTYFISEVKWELYIYVNNNLKYKQSSTSKPGYYTIKLNKMIPLKTNDKFSVVYHLTTVDGSNIQIPACSATDTIKDYTKPGRSFISLNGYEWYDTYNERYSNCIKAFTILRAIPQGVIFSGNKDMAIYYGSNKLYKVKIRYSDGTIADGVKVKVKIGKTIMTVITDSNGYAKFKIKEKPGTYKITITYNFHSIVNKVTVKSTIIAKNIVVKKGKTIKFKVKLLKPNGKILKGKKVKFKFKGKKYKVKTNKKGIAILKINKKFKIGKYKIKINYGKLTISKKIIIKK